ncbi:MAG: TetR/AcrR family transcriptional regulator [Eubacterium sp.]|nr:TetR/AcrR family transcriptional regulator [Eubacterium sp.]
MPARRGNTQQKILDVSRTVFLEHGFRDTSMQMIAKEVGISAPGLYKHFASKEAIFSALVDPLIEGIRKIMQLTEKEKDDLFQRNQTEEVWDKEQTFSDTLDFIYENFDGMKLLICCAEGTAYENIVDRISDYETKIILRTLPTLREKGFSIPLVEEETISLMIRNQYRTYIEFIKNDFSRAQADEYIKAASTFFTSGWRALLGF